MPRIRRFLPLLFACSWAPRAAASAAAAIRFVQRKNLRTEKVGGNTVSVLHEDGTWAVYGHLLDGSVKVRLGESVAAGQQLAGLGSTGRSAGPHLHFSLKLCAWGPDFNAGVRTTPFQFRTAGPGSPRALPWPAQDSVLKRKELAEP